MQEVEVGGRRGRRQRPDIIYNISATLGLVWFVYMLYHALHQDFNSYLEDRVDLFNVEKQQCNFEFTLNDCLNNLSPVLGPFCEGWRKCALKDPPRELFSKVSVQIFAEVLNNFCNTLSDRALGCVFAIVAMTLAR